VSRFVGIDYGTKRIGVAISDGIGLVAHPLEVVRRKDLPDVLTRISDEYGVEAVIVGLPTALDGGEGESASRARALGAEIEDLLGIPVEYVDERFTSRMAEDALLKSDMRRAQRRETIDKVAAAIILQTYLDSRSTGNQHPESGVEPPETQ
jgi:putative holliday junction resolvase